MAPQGPVTAGRSTLEVDRSPHDQQARRGRPGNRRASAGERGYVMAMTALLLIPMMVFTAFATDVGAWYVRGQEIQRAADAAALAAVVWMPDTPKAAEVAFEVAARNGFVDKAGDVPPDGDLTGLELPQVQVSKVGTQRVRVDIWAEGDLYFGSVIDSFEKPKIQRFASAEYVLPVLMGNPTSALGTGSEGFYGVADNFFLDSNGRCRQRRDGDFISTEHSRNCTERSSTGEFNNTSLYDPDGHSFIVDVPADPTDEDLPSGSFVLQARISCYKINNAQMRFTLFGPDDTPLDDYDNEVPANRITNPPVTIARKAGCPGTYNANNDQGAWVNIANLPDPGRYVLRAFNPTGENETANPANYQAFYSLRVTRQGLAPGTLWGCSRIDNVSLPTWDLCPNISAREWMTVVTEKAMLADPNATQADLYLAEIGEEHRGKTLEITLFDAADGIDYIQVLRPDGTPQSITWSSIDNSVYGYGFVGNNIGPFFDEGPFGPQSCSGVPCLKKPAGKTDNWMQDRTIRMQIDLPASYSCVDDGLNPKDCWWQVRYVDGVTGAADINEVTTWSVRIFGDPVRLVE